MGSPGLQHLLHFLFQFDPSLPLPIQLLPQHLRVGLLTKLPELLLCGEESQVISTQRPQSPVTTLADLGTAERFLVSKGPERVNFLKFADCSVDRCSLVPDCSR